MTSDTSLNTVTVHGHVKWFDPTKGFGFIISDAGGTDILLHANVLRNFGQSSVTDGARITVLSSETERGCQAVEVIEISPPEDASAPLKDLVDISAEELAEKEIFPARIKWFDKAKGFGFANVFGDDADVFVHIEVLRRSGLADLQPGEAICLRKMDGERGLMAVEILLWDTVRL